MQRILARLDRKFAPRLVNNLKTRLLHYDIESTDIDESIYKEYCIKYNIHNRSFSLHETSVYVDNRLVHHYLHSTPRLEIHAVKMDRRGICRICKGSGLLYPKYSISKSISKSISDYRLCEDCRGTGFS